MPPEFDPKPLLAKVKSASLVDAVGKRVKHQAHVLDLASPTPGKVLFGEAVTIQFMPVREDVRDKVQHNFGRLFYEAVRGEGAGKVLVLPASGHPDASVGGGTKLSRLEKAGVEGLITDARLRDFDELRDMPFVTYCRGETIKGAKELMPFAANVPVVVGGVTVLPGDYVYADGAGAVVIPGGMLKDVLEDAIAIEEADASLVAEIEGEDPEEVLKGNVPRK